MDKDTLASLAEKFLTGMATDEENALLHSWYDSWQDSDEDVFTDQEETAEQLGKRLLTSIRAQTQVRAAVPGRLATLRRRRWKIAAAASLLLAAAASGWLYFQSTTGTTPASHQELVVNDVAPGANKAILTLADGRKLLLDSTRDGLVILQGDAHVVKTADGQLIYEAGAANGTTVLYNTLSAPRGGQYKLRLPDGSNVWLNAASSIRYPTVFAGGTREVELTGEAYFEVSNNSLQPFIVKAGQQQVKVLGTRFNINAYDDEPSIKTTLLQGSVQVSASGGRAVLMPAQQAIVQQHAAGIQVERVDVDEAVAWIHGKFKFSNTDLKTVMRQLQRWYDVEVIFNGNVPNAHFYGGTPMNSQLSEVLKVLELNGLHFKIDRKTLIVYPN